jgi:hypothetical protein
VIIFSIGNQQERFPGILTGLHFVQPQIDGVIHRGRAFGWSEREPVPEAGDVRREVLGQTGATAEFDKKKYSSSMLPV